MTIYVDELRSTKRSSNWQYLWSCHMFSEDLEELHKFALRLGLKRLWFQNHHRNKWMHHYDITKTKRILALSMGAHVISTRIWIKGH